MLFVFGSIFPVVNSLLCSFFSFSLRKGRALGDCSFGCWFALLTRLLCFLWPILQSILCGVVSIPELSVEVVFRIEVMIFPVSILGSFLLTFCPKNNLGWRWNLLKRRWESIQWEINLGSRILISFCRFSLTVTADVYSREERVF